MKLQRRYLLSFLFWLVLESAVGCNKYCGSDYGAQKVPGSSCADILQKRCDKVKDGIYWINLGQSKPFPVFCNMKAGGWTLVFKLVAGVPGRPATTWYRKLPSYEYSLAALNAKNSFQHHYKKRIVQNWSLFKPSEARMVLYKQSKEEVVLKFRTTKSNNKNWFSQANVLESRPWQDILCTKKNYFTIAGPCWGSSCRDFHINYSYGGCGSDYGWLSLTDRAVCSWESRFTSGVKIIYNKMPTKDNYNKRSKFDGADVFAVFLR